MLENMVQAENEICCTKYPLLLVHGGFFRDLPILSYWGRIATEWKRNGATLFYGGQDSAAPVVVCAEQLKETLKEILAQTGCEKVNLIAHSKGGLDCRCLITKLGMADHVASLTTVCTPHHGAPYADWLLTKAPAGLRRFVVARYNAAFKRLGDKKPDFLGGVQDLTVKNTEIFNREVPNAPGVYYQSVGCYMRSCFSSPFPTNITYMIAYPFCGKNDGLVSPESAKWGEKFHLVNPSGLRGISHGDMIDLYRQNVRGFDVRKFYVNLVADLKKRGF